MEIDEMDEDFIGMLDRTVDLTDENEQLKKDIEELQKNRKYDQQYLDEHAAIMKEHNQLIEEKKISFQELIEWTNLKFDTLQKDLIARKKDSEDSDG